ncbi:unnamed protein product [Rangifer tarandus platyrhynchus]|uniref:Uncharacterized protein n=1 Tax=Rangifer tarandus platyrhynchus TaxID=3082113 RepID=A0AC59YFZ5_RANTA
MPDLWAASLLQLLITLDNTLLIMYEFLRVYPEAKTHSAISITKRKKKTPYLMAETAAAGSVAERAAAVCMQQARLCSEGEIWLSLSFSLPLCISLYLILLNHCSSKLRCIVSPFGYKRSSKPGSQERHHFLPGSGCLSSQKRLDPSLWLPPRLPFRSMMLAERLELSCSAERPANGGAGFPQSSPRPQNKTQRAFDTAASWALRFLHLWEVHSARFPQWELLHGGSPERALRCGDHLDSTRAWTQGGPVWKRAGFQRAGVAGVGERRFTNRLAAQLGGLPLFASFSPRPSVYEDPLQISFGKRQWL